MDLLLSGRCVMKFTVAIEATATEFFEDFLAIDPSDFSREALVEATALCRLTVLIGDPRLILDSIVDRLAETALSLPAGSPCVVDTEEFEWFQRVAQQAILEPLCFAYVVIVKNDELTFFDYAPIVLLNQPIIEELHFTTGCMRKIADRAEYLKVRSELTFWNNDELRAVAPKALKSAKYDVTLAPYVRWSMLTVLFNFGVWCSACHGFYLLGSNARNGDVDVCLEPIFEAGHYERNSSIQRR